MPERDGYIPGVPCWVDASEPDPQAAVDFYGGLFGWEFRDVMPASAEGSYFIAWRETRGWSLFDMSGEPRSGNVAARYGRITATYATWCVGSRPVEEAMRAPAPCQSSVATPGREPAGCSTFVRCDIAAEGACDRCERLGRPTVDVR